MPNCTFCQATPADHDYKIWNFIKQQFTIMKVCESCFNKTKESPKSTN